MYKSWPPPSIRPFERLQVTDGLLMNAQRWRLAHEYHRQRQNVHYQSLNQPGIVCDIGVCIIAPPADVRSQYRDGRWLQIQPGIAIDLFGNFIVVTEPVSFRIASENRSHEPLTVYLVISYVDPEKLRRKQSGELLRETFRVDEKTSLPGETEVELCRILLPPCLEDNEPAPLQLENPADVFFPGYNNLDLRYRPQARSRSQAVVRVAQVKPQGNLASISPSSRSNLSYLLQSVEALYPAMSIAGEVSLVSLQSSTPETQLIDYDLLYLSVDQSQSFTEQELEALKFYLAGGGVLIVDVITQGTKLEEIRILQQQIQDAIARIDTITTATISPYQDNELQAFINIRPELETELQAIQTTVDAEIRTNCLVFSNLAQELGTPLSNLENQNPDHPLRTQPFLFSVLPTINQQSIQILLGGGIIILIGELSSAWGLAAKPPIPRETTRTAQEMGINLLHFAWRKRQLTPLPRQDSASPVFPGQSGRSEPLQSALDKLME